MSTILILQGHPHGTSLCHALADAYAQGATEGGHTVNRLDLGEMKFDPVLHEGYHRDQFLEPDLLHARNLIAGADHLVWIFPNWWGGLPAGLKGLIDRVFLPGFAFRYTKESQHPERLLRGKTARIILTMDSPPWYYRWVIGAPALRMLQRATLEFCGVTPVHSLVLGPVRQASEKKRKGWIETVKAMGQRGQ